MEEFRRDVARNIITLRTRVGMTQSELGEKLNYSDKSISKWERAESLPDAFVLKQMAGIFGVTVDWILSSHEGGEELLPAMPTRRYRPSVILLLSLVSIFSAATLCFVLLWTVAHSILWEIFVWAVPVAAVTALVLCSIWFGSRFHPYILSVLAWGLLAGIYLSLPGWGYWQVFLLGIPAQIVILLVFCIRNTPRPSKAPAPSPEKNENSENEEKNGEET